jgi:serine/threonine protein kinase
MAGGSLAEVLSTKPRWWNATARAQGIIGIVIAMQFVHSQGIIHRDLKPSNILFDAENRIYICDFASSIHESQANGEAQPIGTPLYMAPERYEAEPYSTKVDVFAFSFIVYEMLAEAPVISPNSDARVAMYKVIMGHRAKIPITIHGWVRDIIEKCWDENPDKRMSWDEILQEFEAHEFKIKGEVNSSEIHAYRCWIDSELQRQRQEDHE